MKPRRGAHFTMEEFRLKFPNEAKKLDAQDAARRAGKKYVPPPKEITQGGWRPATPTHIMWIDDKPVKLSSKTEAHVGERLVAEVRAMRAADAAAKRTLTRLYRQVKIALLNIDARDDARGHGVPTYLTVDFCIVHTDGREQYIDAKPRKWKSPEWLRGKLAAQAKLGTKIEETDR